LLSLFNMGGRFFWSSLSDRIGRRLTYAIFFGLGTLLYAAAPSAGRAGSVTVFVGCFALILTMYGGGFATIPAYLSDLFGTRYVGAIHGRLLTAWSAAGVFGPVLVNYIRQYEIDRGVPNAEAYNYTLYLMAGLLVVGFCCNLAVKPVDARHHMKADAPAQRPTESGQPTTRAEESRSGLPVLAAAWALVAIPLGWGVLGTLQRAMALFKR
jgi:MFS family permease